MPNNTSTPTTRPLTLILARQYNPHIQLEDKDFIMYAIFQTGGKQYKVSLGDVIRVELLQGEPGAGVEFNRVFVVRGEKLDVGLPLVERAKVTGTILRNARAPKVRVLKYKRKKQYRRTIGHRQAYSEVLIKNIVAG